MKKNIISTIEFSTKNVSLTVLEKLSTNSIVNIFYDENKIENASTFLNESIKKAEAIIKTKISNVGIIIEPCDDNDYKIQDFSEEFIIPKNIITSNFVTHSVEIIKKKFENCDYLKAILIQPFKFDVTSLGEVKHYLEAPINKKGEKLKIFGVITYIPNEKYNLILQIIKNLSINISQMLLSFQATSQNNLSDNALNSGAILIHVSNHHSFISWNKKWATISNIFIDKFGFKNLVDEIMNLFKCTEDEAKKIIITHSSFKNSEKNVYIEHSENNEEIYFTHKELMNVVENFLTKLFTIAKKFLEQKNILNVPIVISGKIEKFENIDLFAKNKIKSNHISTYNPILFIETNKKIINAIGTLKFMNIMDKTMGRVYNTIIETNPNSLVLTKIQNKERKWLSKIITRNGENYEWN